MLVSVIIPCYNRAQYLKHCLESIKAQGVDDLEIIVGDDGSDDPEVRRVAEGAGATFITGEHTGHPSVAHNRALRNAHGKYAVLVADDDMLTPGSIKTRLAVIQKYENAFVCGIGARLDGEAGYDEACALLKDNKLNLTIGYKPAGYLPYYKVHGGTVMAPMALFEKFGLYDESPLLRLGQDREMWGRWWRGGVKMAYVQRVFTFYRQHTGNISKTVRKGEWNAMVQYREKALSDRRQLACL